MMPVKLENIIPAPLEEQLSKRPSAIWGQNVAFLPGERIFVQAPSGSGKTTLVHILYGLRKDYKGNALLGDSDIKTMDAEAIANARATPLSIIFQDMRLFPTLTAIENLEIKRALTNTVQKEEMDAWMGMLGISHKKNALAATLSFGEQQRVAIIRALLQPFQWLIMDEPFSHLDKENTYKAINLIETVCDRNKAGFLLADLDENVYFNYTRTLRL